jgi:hypothetical protein
VYFLFHQNYYYYYIAGSYTFHPPGDPPTITTKTATDTSHKATVSTTTNIVGLTLLATTTDRDLAANSLYTQEQH